MRGSPFIVITAESFFGSAPGVGGYFFINPVFFRKTVKFSPKSPKITKNPDFSKNARKWWKCRFFARNWRENWEKMVEKQPKKWGRQTPKTPRFSKISPPRECHFSQNLVFVQMWSLDEIYRISYFLESVHPPPPSDGIGIFANFSWGFGAKKNRKNRKDAGSWLAMFRNFAHFLTIFLTPFFDKFR